MKINPFRDVLEAELRLQSEAFAVSCIFMPDDSSNLLCNNHLQTVVQEALLDVTKAKSTLVLDNPQQLAVILSPCGFEHASELSRIIRNCLMRKLPSARPNLSVVHAGESGVNVSELVDQLCDSLQTNIETKSTQIDVIQHSRD